MQGCRGQTCHCMADHATCFPDSDNGDCRSNTCLNYYRLSTLNGSTFECVRQCPLATYSELVPYNQCVRCEDAIANCSHCSKPSRFVVCNSCETPYVLDQNRCNQKAASSGGCRPSTCVAPVVSVVLIAVLVAIALLVWLMVIRPARRSTARQRSAVTREPPTRAEVDVISKVGDSAHIMLGPNIIRAAISAHQLTNDFNDSM